MLIHLGDVEGKEDYVEALAGCPVHIVSGNNDFFSDLPWEEEFLIGEHHVFITHGHGYFVGMDEERLKAEARGRGADIVMYGHTPQAGADDRAGPGDAQSGQHLLPEADGAPAPATS